MLSGRRAKVRTMQSRKTRRIVKSRRYLLKKKVTYLLVTVAALALVSFLVYYALGPKNPTVIDTTPKIAIVDHLSVQWPDPTFNQTMLDILNETGLQVDYYPSQDVTVDFYRDLPKHNYKLIVFRVHSTAESSVEGTPPFVVFFTSENYTNLAHVSEQQDMRVVYVRFPDSEPVYFGITPKFVSDSMEGRFNDTVIIAMGCEGLKENTMAQAFVEKGAKAYISWNGSVSAYHTDNATVSLLRHLITENQTVEEAVRQTMNEVGPDPADRSILMFYPDNAGGGFFQVNLTATAPAVRPARRSTSKNDGNSDTTLVPRIFTLCAPL
jgi:hypothetical protein